MQLAYDSIALGENRVSCPFCPRCESNYQSGHLTYTLVGKRRLHYQLQIYGDKIDALNNKLSPQAAKGNFRYLEALPKEFTKEDLVNLRLANNESPVVKTIIYRWVKEQMVEKIGTNLWRKCS